MAEGEKEMINQVRRIEPAELAQLLLLYQDLNPDDPSLELGPDLLELWRVILADPDNYYLVLPVDGKLVASCNLVIIKNLTRGARPYALIENVVTHHDYRQKGYGTAVLQKAIAIAKARNCYKVMLMTSRKEESTLQFYDQAGFVRGDKTGYVIRF